MKNGGSVHSYVKLPEGIRFGNLIGGLEHCFLFFHIFNILGINKIIIPTDEIIFFRGVGIPPILHHQKDC